MLIALVSDEATQMRKVVLHNKMALDLLNDAQEGTCVILYTDCCVYISDNPHNVSQDLTALRDEINHILATASDPYTAWWNSLGSLWHSILLGLFGFYFPLLVLGCSFSCICGIWIQCANIFITQDPC